MRAIREQNRDDINYGADRTFTNNCLPTTPSKTFFPQPKWVPQPKLDATDRRQIEAYNEDKSHTTKEQLDDIKSTYNKEKKKKEQNNTPRYQSGVNNERWVSKILIWQV